jgi:hypothetical protein
MPLVRALGPLRIFQGLGACLSQQAIQGFGSHALERAEVGRGQLGGLEITQQRGTLAALGLFGFTLGIGIVAAARQLISGHLAVLVGQLASGLTVQIETLRGLGHGDQVGGRAGIATEEGRQGLLAEHAGRTLLDINLDAQLQGLGVPLKQSGKQLRQAGGGGGRRLSLPGLIRCGSALRCDSNGWHGLRQGFRRGFRRGFERRGFSGLVGWRRGGRGHESGV